MNFDEYAAKAKVLAPAGIPVPRAKLALTPEEAKAAFAEIGPCVVKAQVPVGKRGKSGGILPADSADEADAAARAILGMSIGSHRVEKLLIEERAEIAHEFYAAVMTDFTGRRPLVLFSSEGGIDIEEVAALRPDAVRRRPVDI
ncbi:MAG: ATP-grasp domain-containing protein, partial [Pseudomonadota bacterium]